MRAEFSQSARPAPAACIFALAATAGLATATPPITTVAVTGQAAPGYGAGSNYASFPGDPAVNAAGKVAYLGTVSGAPVTTAIWAGTPGSVSLITKTTDPFPAAGVGVTISTLGYPSLSTTGLQVAFEGLLTGAAAGITTANDEILLAGPPGSLSLVLREGSPAVGAPAGVNFGTVNSVLVLGGIGSVPRIAFSAYLTGTGVTTTNNIGLWAGPPGSITLSARTGSAAPGTAAGVNFAGVSSPVITAPGQLAFPGALTGTGVTTSNNAGIWAGTAAAPLLAARLGTAAPGAGAGVNFADLGDPVQNEAGQLAFTGGLTGTGVNSTNNTGIWAGAPGSIVLVVRAGSAATAAGAGINFGTEFSSPSINRTGRLAFFSSLTGAGAGVTTANDSALWTGTAGNLTLIAREGTPAAGTPVGVVYRGRPLDPVINGNGQVAFLCFLSGTGVTAANDLGLWATDAAGVPQLMVREGDSIPVAPAGTRIVSGLFMLTGSGAEEGRRSPYNDLGQIAFRASFTDGSTGIFVAQGPTACRTDIDANGQIQPADIAGFVAIWVACLSSGGAAGDFDRNGVVEPADIASFVADWVAALSTGC